VKKEQVLSHVSVLPYKLSHHYIYTASHCTLTVGSTVIGTCLCIIEQMKFVIRKGTFSKNESIVAQSFINCNVVI
jgi:hypothetical protein